jgi:hypothetical protein
MTLSIISYLSSLFDNEIAFSMSVVVLEDCSFVGISI